MPLFRGRAPARIDFLGGGSDCPPFSTEHGGCVLNAGINRYAVSSLEVGEHLSGVEIVSRDLKQTVRADSVADLEFDGELDLLKAALKRGGVEGPLRLVTEVDVPPQSGLGASAAVTVSVLAVCRRALGRPVDPAELAEEAFAAERLDLGLAGGKQDQYGAAFGDIRYHEFQDPEVAVHDVGLAPELLAELEHRLLLLYTGETHLSENIHADIKAWYRDDASPCKQAMFGLARIGREGGGLLERGDLLGFAKLLNQNWLYHKDLHHSCTNERLDRIYEIAEQCGAIGGKTCGAGGGGCVVFYCGEGRRRELRDALVSIGCQPMSFCFDRTGVQTWQVRI